MTLSKIFNKFDAVEIENTKTVYGTKSDLFKTYCELINKLNSAPNCVKKQIGSVASNARDNSHSLIVIMQPMDDATGQYRLKLVTRTLG